MSKRSKSKRIIRQKLSKEQLRDMMENKLRASTVPSKKKYVRKSKYPESQ